MEPYQRISVWGQFVLGVLSLGYAVLDYTFHVDLKGDLTNLLAGLLTAAICFYFWWASRRDAEKGNVLDNALTSLRRDFEKLKKGMERTRVAITGLLGCHGFLQRIYRRLLSPELHVQSNR
jgi:hypothetical protein